MPHPKVVLVGCGNIGRRHLEALEGLDSVLDIDIVEPFAPARSVISASERLRIRLLKNIAEIDPNYDLAIVATAANGRRQLLETLLDVSNIPCLLIEKILFNQEKDYSLFDQCLNRTGSSAYVNCGRRGFESYARLREEIGGNAPVSVSLKGAGWNLCSNAIHFIDIIEFVVGQKFVSLSGERLDSEIISAKRPGLFELTGTLEGRLESGGEVVIECLSGALSLPTITFNRDNERWVVNESEGSLVKSRAERRTESLAFETPYVSQMSYLYAELLEGRSRLTPYAVSKHQHVLLLNALRPKMGLSNKDDNPCPIT